MQMKSLLFDFILNGSSNLAENICDGAFTK
jgi:hypothetical protein